jgi:hypothetical protein
MATDTWETIRQAAATKARTSSGCIAAGLRQSDDRLDDTNMLPALKWLWPMPLGEIGRPNGNVEEYDLRISAELLIGQPTGKARTAAIRSAIVRALQLEWRSSITLGLAPTVSWSFLESVDGELDEFAETGYDGCRIELVVRVTEIFNPGRTA